MPTTLYTWVASPTSSHVHCVSTEKTITATWLLNIVQIERQKNSTDSVALHMTETRRTVTLLTIAAAGAPSGATHALIIAATTSGLLKYPVLIAAPNACCCDYAPDADIKNANRKVKVLLFNTGNGISGCIALLFAGLKNRPLKMPIIKIDIVAIQL